MRHLVSSCLSPRCVCEHAALLDYLFAYTSLMHTYVCVFSVIGCERAPAHVDNILINVCEETDARSRGVSANLLQVLVSRIPPVPINKRPK